jgi:hypothetical protein
MAHAEEYCFAFRHTTAVQSGNEEGSLYARLSQITDPKISDDQKAVKYHGTQISLLGPPLD